MIMKKKFFSVILILAGVCAYSQPGNKLKYGIKLGLAFANTKLDYTDVSPKIKAKTGFTAGGFVDLPISKSTIFQAALLYVRKGGKEAEVNGYTYPFNYNYLEIPLNILYKSKAGNGNYFLGGGFSPAFHLNSAYYGNAIKGFDLGINLLASYQTAIGFSINLGYTYGLLNAAGKNDYITKIQNRYFSITAGYEF
jgi:hypothetical protein